jgi:hypothetical protein
MSSDNIDQQEVDARFQIVKERYGTVIDPNDFGAVRKGIEGVVKAAEELRSVKLDNSVGPSLVFTPYIGDE